MQADAQPCLGLQLFTVKVVWLVKRVDRISAVKVLQRAERKGLLGCSLQTCATVEKIAS